MSSNLVWEPENRQVESLAYELKVALRGKYGEPVNAVLGDQTDIAYLEGLRDAGVSEAQMLLDAIEKHARVRVREVY